MVSVIAYHMFRYIIDNFIIFQLIGANLAMFFMNFIENDA